MWRDRMPLYTGDCVTQERGRRACRRRPHSASNQSGACALAPGVPLAVAHDPLSLLSVLCGVWVEGLVAVLSSPEQSVEKPAELGVAAFGSQLASPDRSGG